MNELVKALQRFLMRDVSFILGGGSVLLAFLHVYGEWPPQTPPPVYLLFLGAGFAYAIGLAVQETALLLHIVRTRAGARPPEWASKLYQCYDPRYDKGFTQNQYDQARTWLLRNSTPQRHRDDHERTESLKQIGTTMGPCVFLSGVILFVGLLSRNMPWRIPFGWGVSAGLTIVGLALFVVGWMKVIEQAQNLTRRFNARDKDGRSPCE